MPQRQTAADQLIRADVCSPIKKNMVYDRLVSEYIDGGVCKLTAGPPEQSKGAASLQPIAADSVLYEFIFARPDFAVCRTRKRPPTCVLQSS